MSRFTRPIQTILPSVSFETSGWGHDGDTLNRVPVEATKRLEIPAQQVGRTQTDRRPQNGTIVLWKFRQDGERSLWRQHRDHVDGLAQPFQLCRVLPRRRISLASSSAYADVTSLTCGSANSVRRGVSTR